MAENEPSQNNDPELAYLKSKATASTVTTIEAILEQPQMKKLIRKTFVKEGLLQGFIMAIIFVGLMMVYNAAKAALNSGWQADFAVGTFLILAGALYLWRKIRAK